MEADIKLLLPLFVVFLLALLMKPVTGAVEIAKLTLVKEVVSPSLKPYVSGASRVPAIDELDLPKVRIELRTVETSSDK